MNIKNFIDSLLSFSLSLGEREDSNQPPDAADLWQTYSTNVTHIACRMSSGDVCVKYTYIYNRAGTVTHFISHIYRYRYSSCPFS